MTPEQLKVWGEELCANCHDCTGRGGPYSASLYDSEGYGPYCDECWAEVVCNEERVEG